MVQTKEIMTLAVEIGDIMLRSGAELYRVEDSLIRILEAYGIEDFDVYVLSNGIFLQYDPACASLRCESWQSGGFKSADKRYL